MTKKYERYVQLLQKVADLEAVQAILGWDQEVNMPVAGAASRARQLATVAGLGHELSTSEELGEVLETLHAHRDQLSEGEQRNIELSRKDYLRQRRYTRDFVERRSRISSEAYEKWLKGREDNDSTEYLKVLEEMVKLKREEAEILGYKAHPYDALIDLFEPDMTVAELDPLFAEVRKKLVRFVAKIREQPQVESDFMRQSFPIDDQWDFSLLLLKGMGYDFNSGRQDLSPHPFTTTFGPGDIRVTTRSEEKNFANICWSSIHEGGHALYEQGLLPEQYGLPLGKAVSLAIHESQSRLWENNVGRGKKYWEYWYLRLQEHFPRQLARISLDQFYHAINRIEPNFIRTEADELHYHFHILIRYEIEKQLIEGSIETAQLPEIWASRYREYLGVEVPDARRGILQDIHWAYGSFGYFPTYSLGSFYAAQFFQQAVKELPELERELATGSTKALLDWLRDQVHRHGQHYSASDLCKKITGEKLNFQYFMDYAEKKYGEIYFKSL